MKEYMYLYRGGDPSWFTAPAAEREAMMAKWATWLGELGEKGRLVAGGSPLSFDGKRVARDGVITDIAASELKELVTGYSIVRAESYEEAAQLARGCPILLREGTRVEVRCVMSA